MDYYPTQEQTQEPASLAVYQGNNLSWLSWRSAGAIGGGLTLVIIGAIAMRSTAIPEQAAIKVAPLQSSAPTSQAVNQVILENSKASLEETKLATNLKIEEVQKAMLRERSVAILDEANKQLADPKSPCFRSVLLQGCFVLGSFVPEHQKRYDDAVLSRQWSKANHSLFEIQAARYALDGAPNVPFTPSITSAAIVKEVEVRSNILLQSDNAIASEMLK